MLKVRFCLRKLMTLKQHIIPQFYIFPDFGRFFK